MIESKFGNETSWMKEIKYGKWIERFVFYIFFLLYIFSKEAEDGNER